MRRALLILFPAILASCADHSATVVENRDQQGLLRSRVRWVGAKKQGETILFHPNGREAKRGNYEADLKEGSWQVRSPDDRPLALLHYRRGILHGQCRWMDANGQVLADERYINGRLEGHVRRYFPDGRLRQEMTFRNGRADGVYLRHQDASEDSSAGTVIHGHYINGRCNGTWTGRSSDGLLLSEGVFVDDRRVGVWRYWDRNGKLLREEEFDAQGRPIGERVP